MSIRILMDLLERYDNSGLNTEHKKQTALEFMMRTREMLERGELVYISDHRILTINSFVDCRCRGCVELIPVGAQIIWQPQVGSWHPECWDTAKAKVMP